MDNFCTQCGNPLNGKNKCDKCGHITSDSVIDKISHTVKNYDYKGKAEQVVKYSKDIVQSEQFQNVKNETIKRTHKFFKCNINNDEDFINANKSSNKCLYIIFIAIAMTVFLFPFYKAFGWVDGILGFLVKILSTLGLISRIVIIPLVIALGIKYLIARKAIKEYKNENSDSLLPTIRINRKLVLSTLIACIISVPIVNKINDFSYKNFSSNAASFASDEEKTVTSSNNIQSQNNVGANAIIGTWKKETGVCYIFEPDGHMSTSLSQNYDKSAGTAGDGAEVTMLLGDIEDCGRPIHGGQWKYVGVEDGVYRYTLFYNGSNHYCYLKEGTNNLGIILESGIGEMSFLHK